MKWDSAQGCWVILAGTFKAQSLVESGIEEKTENKTGTGDHIAHPVRTGGDTEPHYEVHLGNNGKLTFATAEAKSVFNANGDDIDGLTAMVGDELTYQVRVTNTKANPADATIVDTIPLGTELVEGSVKVYKDGTVQTGGYSFTQNASTLTWNFAAIPAGSAYVAEFKVKVTELAMDQSTVSNQASVTIGENTYKTNLVSNPIEGKKATGATSTVVPADGVQVGDQIVYTIQYYNDTDKAADVKIVDGGYGVSKKVFDYGANISTVVGYADEQTLAGAVKAAEEAGPGHYAMADLMHVPDYTVHQDKLNKVGIHYVSAHAATDREDNDENFEKVLQRLADTKLTAKLAVAGRITLARMPLVKKYNPDLIIVGSAITKAEDPRAAAKAFKEAMA